MRDTELQPITGEKVGLGISSQRRKGTIKEAKSMALLK
jgi:hypothetical protein